MGLTVNFSVLLWRLCTCICKKVVCYFAGPPSTLPLSTQTSSGSSTLSKKRPPPPPPGHKRTLSDPPSPLPHGPQNKGPIPWGEFWKCKSKGQGKTFMMADIWSLVSFYLVLAFQWLQLDVMSAQINQQFHLLSLPPRLGVSLGKAGNPPRCPGAPPVPSSASLSVPQLPRLCPHPAPLPLLSSAPALLLLLLLRSQGCSFGAPRAHTQRLCRSHSCHRSFFPLLSSVHTSLVGMCCLSLYLLFVMLSVHTQRLLGLHPATSRSYTETVHFNFYFYQDTFLTDAFWNYFPDHSDSSSFE